MNSTLNNKYPNLWPALDYESFKPTQYLLHRATQMMGKLKLTTPFEPHWSNVALWLTDRGLTTGVIPYEGESFTVTLDFSDQQIMFSHSSGKNSQFGLGPSSVSKLFQTFHAHLLNIGIDIKLNPKPQEIPDGLAFDIDTDDRPYDENQVKIWWQVLLSSYQALMQYHALFSGISPGLGFMWGTFDLRDARYTNKIVSPPVPGFIERNAMDVEQVEAGWWAGNDIYPKPAYYSFTYPKPKDIEKIPIKPEEARWNESLGEFILDYEAVRTAENSEKMLLDFFNSTYYAGAKLAGWDPKLNNSGKPK